MSTLVIVYAVIVCMSVYALFAVVMVPCLKERRKRFIAFFFISLIGLSWIVLPYWPEEQFGTIRIHHYYLAPFLDPGAILTIEFAVVVSLHISVSIGIGVFLSQIRKKNIDSQSRHANYKSHPR